MFSTHSQTFFKPNKQKTMMKKNILKLLSLAAFVACMGPLFTSCQKENPQEEAVKTLDGSWTLSQATAAYRLGSDRVKLETPLNHTVINSVFGSTSFTFNADGTLYVGDNKACSYEVNEDATMLILHINEMTFTCNIVVLTDSKVELGLSGRQVINNILIYIIGLSLGDIQLDATCSLVFTR
jgi:hypothetical protein